MKLYTRGREPMRGYTKDVYFEHTHRLGTCYHYDVAGTSRPLELIRRGAKPLDTMGEGFGCER